MRLNPEIFKQAANMVKDRASAPIWRRGACAAIRECFEEDEAAEYFYYKVYFCGLYMSLGYLGAYYFGTRFDAQEQLARAIALDFAAYMLEDEQSCT